MEADIYKVIENIKKLDLSQYPYSEIVTQIANAGIIGHIVVTLRPGYPIFRARPNGNGEHFFSKCQLTYKPHQLNTSCQRASLPNTTMFYGSILPEIIVAGDLDNTRVAPTFEAVSWLRDKTTKGHGKVTYSRWVATENLNLMAIVQHKDFLDKSSYIRELMGSYDEFLENNIEKKESSMAFTTFLANEFAKEVKENDYEYLISAAYSKFAVDNGFDGVLYPSVKMGGAGLNVALTPEAADMKLQLSLVLECSAYKLYDRTVLDNDYQAILYPNQTHFELIKIDGEEHGGVENCLNELGLKSLDELA